MTFSLKEMIITALILNIELFGCVMSSDFNCNINCNYDYELPSQSNYFSNIPISDLTITEYPPRPTWHESEDEVYNQALALAEHDRSMIAVEKQVSFFRGKVCPHNTKGCVRADIVVYFSNRPPLVIEVKNYSKYNLYSLNSVLKNQHENYKKHLPHGAEVIDAVDFTGQKPTPQRVVNLQYKTEQPCFVLGCI